MLWKISYSKPTSCRQHTLKLWDAQYQVRDYFQRRDKPPRTIFSRWHYADACYTVICILACTIKHKNIYTRTMVIEKNEIDFRLYNICTYTYSTVYIYRFGEVIFMMSICKHTIIILVKLCHSYSYTSTAWYMSCRDVAIQAIEASASYKKQQTMWACCYV